MMNITPLVIYAAAMVAYGWHFTERNPMVGRTATTLLIFAALAHTFVIGILTIGIIVGAIWAAQAQGGYAGDPRVQAMSLKDPKIIVALVCWLVYSFELFAARRIGWGGRRAAYLSTLGFVIVLLNFVPISYFLTKSHNF